MMKFTFSTVLSALLTKSAFATIDDYGEAPPVCSTNLFVDFSEFPDGFLPTDALADRGIPEICCLVAGNDQHECLIKDGKLMVPEPECFEIAVTFASHLYTAGFEIGSPPPAWRNY